MIKKNLYLFALWMKIFIKNYINQYQIINYYLKFYELENQKNKTTEK